MGIGSVLNGLLKPLGICVAPLDGAKVRAAVRGPRYSLASGDVDEIASDVRRVLNVVDYTKSSGTQYAADQFEGAYHSLELDGQVFLGQRHPKERLDGVPFDFSGKSVMDIGCNQGGMLYALADRIRWGVGVDYDSRMVNAANRVKSFKCVSNLDFYVFNLEEEHLGFLDSYCRDDTLDVVFLLSVCMWIRNWTDVIDWCSSHAKHLLFESNGSRHQQDSQEAYLRGLYSTVSLVRDTSPDDIVQKDRRLFFCSR